MVKLRDIASVVRSKNAGAFEITFDVLFSDENTYQRTKQTGVISPQLFARLYNVPVEECDFLTFDAAYAFKCTILRPIPSGDVGDTDVYGAQQHAPLLEVDIPLEA